MGNNRVKAAAGNSGYVEKRHEERFSVPDRCRDYMTFHIKTGKDQVPAVLANFSRSGVLFETSLPLEKGTRTECLLSLSLLLSRAISFWISVKYCYKNEKSYIIGAEIDTIGDHTWFDLFEEIYDFIVVQKESGR